MPENQKSQSEKNESEVNIILLEELKNKPKEVLVNNSKIKENNVKFKVETKELNRIRNSIPYFDFGNMTKLEFLGKGGFGIVFKFYEKITGDFFAIKFNTNKEDFEDMIYENDIMNKIEEINKDNIFLGYKGLFRDKTEADTCLIIMESGVIDLLQILKMRKHYSLSNALYIFKSLLIQLNYLQENGIAHRDIKPANVMLVEDKTKKNHYIYKISDFEIGCTLAKGETQCNEIKGLTKNYCSPEIRRIIKSNTDGTYYDPFKSDVYSFAVMMLG